VRGGNRVMDTLETMASAKLSNYVFITKPGWTE